jgi:YbbR domain-containing protein
MKSANRFTRIFAHNYMIKLFCLLSALFFWFYVTLESQFDYSTDVPLSITNAPEGWILLKPLPATVKVRFRGTGRSYVSFRFQERLIELDLWQVKNNTSVSLSPDMVKNLPMGVRALSVLDPESVVVHWDRFVERRVPVLPGLALEPAEGFTLVGDLALDPDSVMVSGPQSVVDTMAGVRTETRSYRGLVKDLKEKVPLVPDSSGAFRVSEPAVRFRVAVQRLGEKEILGVRVVAVNAPEGALVTVSPETLNLGVQGGVDVLARLTPADIQATVDVRALGKYPAGRVPAMLRIPPDVTFSSVEPQVFEVRVRP